MIPSAIEAPVRSFGWLAPQDEFCDDVNDYPHLAYSMKSVRYAGEALAGVIEWSEDGYGLALETFAIANSWRDSHVLPMRSIRGSIMQRMRSHEIGGFTAARPKRMTSIRKKLQRFTVKLDQINDLGGCRAVLDDIAGVRKLIEACKSMPHEIRQHYPYIDDPKPDGYRCHHVVFAYNGGTDRAAFNGRRIELQIRTRLQHSWATAVEAVGLYRGEDMKAGQGNADWLRLFSLISAEFAEAEGCPVNSQMPPRHDRLAEIRKLNSQLGAVDFLDHLKAATQYFTEFVHPTEKPAFYIIRYDNAEHTVSVQGHSNAIEGAASLGALERSIETGEEDINVVLVEVSKIDRLAEAYPNYFGDVTLFTKNLRAICGGKNVVEYSMLPQETVAPKRYVKPDFSWLKRRFRWK